MIDSKITKPTITAIIVAKNEELMIANCIETLRWCDEVLVIDNGSEDTTAGIAEKLGARVVGFASDNFARVREEGLKRAKTDWIFYIDADERVLPKLSKEIMVHAETNSTVAMRLKRHNIMYGRPLKFGGLQKDFVTRVFKRTALTGWKGRVHESPIFKGPVSQLFTPLLHLTHRNIADGLSKSIAWTAIEAELLHKAGSPQVKAGTLIRKPAMEFMRRFILKRGYKDRLTGFIESLVQAMNRFLIYVQLWELQQKPSLADRYKKTEQKIAQYWQKES